MLAMGLIRERLRNFMQGRYGVDTLSKVLMGAAFICAVLSVLFGRVFYVFGILILGYVYFRMFSMNYEKRYRENRAFLDKKNRVCAFFRREKSRMEQRKMYHIYTCPSCRQKIRIPKGRGRIMVTCPKCKCEFEKRS